MPKTGRPKSKKTLEYESPEHWENRLKIMHLTMAAGCNPNWLSYGHIPERDSGKPDGWQEDAWDTLFNSVCDSCILSNS